MYTTKALSLYRDYKPVTKKHKDIDIQAYLSAKIEKDIYSDLNACIQSLSDSIICAILAESEQKSHGRK